MSRGSQSVASPLRKTARPSASPRKVNGNAVPPPESREQRMREIGLPDAFSPADDPADRLFLLPPLEREFLALLLQKENIVPHLRMIVRRFGFDDFHWSFTPVERNLPEATIYHIRLTNHEWSRLYDERQYWKIDTRIKRLERTRLPIAWDQASERGRTPEMDTLLDEALRFGIGSGVLYQVPEIGHNGVFAGFIQRATEITEKRRLEIERHLPHMIALTRYLTDGLMRPVMEHYAGARIETSPLSRRERQVLGLTAAGHSAKTVSRLLNITERTVIQHLIHAREKLKVDTRMEAVVLAVRDSLILNTRPKQHPGPF